MMNIKNKLLSFLVIFLLMATTLTGVSAISINKKSSSETIDDGNNVQSTLSEYCIGDVVDTDVLTYEHAYGLAFNPKISSGRIYISDFDNHAILVYKFDTYGKLDLESTIDTTSFNSDFKNPRDLAYAYYTTRVVNHYIFALTYYDIGGDGIQDPRLWRIHLNNDECEYVNLKPYLPGDSSNKPEVWGLACDGDNIFISWNTLDPNLALPYSDRIKNGILYFPVVKPADWENAKSGEAEVTFIPNSGYENGDTGHQHRGLAYMKLGTGSYFWATYGVPSGSDKIYLADSVTGRGIFSFDGPSDICGLTYGAGYLWAINRVGNSNAHIYKIKVHINSPGDNCYTTPIEGECSCRHLIGTARSEANGIITSSIQDKHIFAIPPTTSGFSNQWIPHEWGVLDSNYQMNDAIVYEGSYKPAGDSSSTQYYYEISIPNQHLLDGDELITTCSGDVWTSNQRLYVYPHMCSKNGQPTNYLQDDDLYEFTNVLHTAAYKVFTEKMKEYIYEEYGSTMSETNNPYWIGRNILEMVRENYWYSNGYKKDAWKNIENFLDGNINNNFMACSATAFTMVGLSRYNNVAARWIGTMKTPGLGGDFTDLNNNGFLDGDEKVGDISSHRWAQLWMGELYGWQRFDATPIRKEDNPNLQAGLPQYKLMNRACQGVTNRDFIVTIGSGYQEPFINSFGEQGYNILETHFIASNWDYSGNNTWVDWYNARNIRITKTTVNNDELLLDWACDGMWDVPCPCGECSNRLKITVEQLGFNQPAIEPIIKTVYPNENPVTIDLSGAPMDLYKVTIQCTSDSLTGTTALFPKTRHRSLDFNFFNFISNLLNNTPKL